MKLGGFILLREHSFFELVLHPCLIVSVHEHILLNRVSMKIAEKKDVARLQSLLHH